MAVAFGSTSSTAYAGGLTGITITAPTGITNGDVLLAHILWSGNGTVITPPSGWTQVGSTMTAIELGFAFYLNSAIYKKVASSESGNYGWGFNAASSAQGMITRYTGANGTINAFSSAWTGGTAGIPGTSDCTASSITTTVNGCMLVFEGFDWGDTANALSPPTGYTERVEVNPLIYSADVIQSTAGATGSVTHICNSNNNNPRGAWLVALEPSTGSGGVTVNVTGSSASSANGNESVIGKARVSPTGRAGATAIGNESVVAKASVSVTGRAGATAIGNESVVAKARVSPTGVLGTTARGSVSVIAGGSVTVPVTGRSLTTTINSVVIPNVQVLLTGRAATLSSGNVAAGPYTGVTVYLDGWGYGGGWGDGGWGEGNFETSLTTGTGIVQISGKPSVFVTGSQASLAVGSVSIRSAPTVHVTGKLATLSSGTAGLSLGISFGVTGDELFTDIGEVLTEFPTAVYGEQLTTDINDVFVIGDALVMLSGNELVTDIGQAYVHAWERVPDKNTNWTPVVPSGNTWTPVSAGHNTWTPVNKG